MKDVEKCTQSEKLRGRWKGIGASNPQDVACEHRERAKGEEAHDLAEDELRAVAEEDTV